MYPMHLCCYEAKLTNLKMKTRPKQLLGSITLNVVLPAVDVTTFKHASLFGQGVMIRLEIIDERDTDVVVESI